MGKIVKTDSAEYESKRYVPEDGRCGIKRALNYWLDAQALTPMADNDTADRVNGEIKALTAVLKAHDEIIKARKRAWNRKNYSANKEREKERAKERKKKYKQGVSQKLCEWRWEFSENKKTTPVNAPARISRPRYKSRTEQILDDIAAGKTDDVIAHKYATGKTVIAIYRRNRVALTEQVGREIAVQSGEAVHGAILHGLFGHGGRDRDDYARDK